MNHKTYFFSLFVILTLSLAGCQTAASDLVTLPPQATATTVATAAPVESTAPPPTATPIPPTPIPTATPVPPTPTPEPTPVVLFNDTFDTDQQGWAGTDANSTRSIADGQLTIEIKEDYEIVLLPVPQAASRDVAVNFDVTVESDGDGAIVGVMCRTNNTGDFYWFELASSQKGGGFGMYQSIAGKETELIPPTFSTAVKPTGQVNAVQLICSGQHLQFSVNDTVLVDQEDETLTSGGVTVLTLGEPGSLVIFDDLSITLPEGVTPIAVEPGSVLDPGDVILETDFASAEGWDLMAFSFEDFKRTDNYTFEVRDDNLYIEVPEKFTTVYGLHNGYANTNHVQLDLDVETVAGPNRNNISLTCRNNPLGWYEFGMHSGGLWSIYKYEYANGYTTLADAASTAIHTQKAKNHLTVVCQGDELSFYVNDVLLKTVHDAQFAAGTVGFSVTTFDIVGAGVAFENLTVTVPDPANPPGGAVAPAVTNSTSASNTSTNTGGGASATSAQIFVASTEAMGNWCTYIIGVSGFSADESVTWSMTAPNGQVESFPGIVGINQGFLFTQNHPLGNYVLVLQSPQHSAQTSINWTGTCP